MYLFGASGHGKVIAEIAELLEIKVEGFIDENNSINKILKYKVHHVIPEQLRTLFISIGDNEVRKAIYLKNQSYHYPVLIHPNSNVSKSAEIGDGSVIMAGATINAQAEIGKHVIINTNASIDHDCVLEDCVHISPNVALAGNVSVKEGAHIGIGSSVIQGVKIGKWSVIGAGSVIIRDVPDYAVVVGNPAKVIKFRNK